MAAGALVYLWGAYLMTVQCDNGKPGKATPNIPCHFSALEYDEDGNIIDVVAEFDEELLYLEGPLFQRLFSATVPIEKELWDKIDAIQLFITGDGWKTDVWTEKALNISLPLGASLKYMALPKFYIELE